MVRRLSSSIPPWAAADSKGMQVSALSHLPGAEPGAEGRGYARQTDQSGALAMATPTHALRRARVGARRSNVRRACVPVRAPWWPDGRRKGRKDGRPA